MAYVFLVLEAVITEIAGVNAVRRLLFNCINSCDLQSSMLLCAQQ
jgi:hypothetical protein